MLEKTLQSALDCKMKPINPKGNQSWIFFGRTDAEAEASILWPPDAKNELIGKDLMLGKIWGHDKGMTEDEMVGRHHQLNGHEFEQALGVGDGQGSLVYCSPWGHKELDTIEQLKLTERLDTEVREIKNCIWCLTVDLEERDCHVFERAMWQGIVGRHELLRAIPSHQPARKWGPEFYNHKELSSGNSMSKLRRPWASNETTGLTDIMISVWWDLEQKTQHKPA